MCQLCKQEQHATDASTKIQSIMQTANTFVIFYTLPVELRSEDGVDL
jgi:hypothetical protein